MDGRPEIRPVPPATKYGLSADGTVFRLAPGNGTRPYRERKPSKNHKGYWRVAIVFDDGISRNVMVSRLVLMAWVGPPPTPRHHAAHRDGDKDHNNLSNLKWASPVENAADKLLHGTLARGERQGFAKLTEADVLHLRSLRRTGNLNAAKEAARLGVHIRSVRDAARGVTWAWLPEPSPPKVEPKQLEMFSAPGLPPAVPSARVSHGATT